MITSPIPIDFEATRRSWRRATPVQKATRVGIVGGLLGGLVYLIFGAGSARRTPQVPELPPEPVERDPSAILYPAPPKRGHYR
jgi:hypothetical protein